MDGKISFDLTSLIMQLIETYGAAGFAMTFGVYYLWVLQKKLDKLVNMNYKMFGALTTFANKQLKDQDESKREIEDDD